MKISVIIPSYNTETLLQECLQTVRSDNISVETIVVDNGSHDASVSMVRNEFPKVKVIANDSNLGFAQACNQGIRISSGKYAFILNTDTLVWDGCLETLYQYAEENPRAAVIGCRQVSETGRIHRTYCTGFIFCQKGTSDVPVSIRGWVAGCGMFLRREALNQTGLFDEDFFFGSEDTEICWRMYKAGWEIHYNPKAIITHYGAKSSDINPKVLEKALDGRLLLAEKHAGRLVQSYAKFAVNVDRNRARKSSK